VQLQIIATLHNYMYTQIVYLHVFTPVISCLD